MNKIIDISLPVHPAMLVYPGNQQTEFEEIVKPSGSRLTTVTFDTHAGTHVDGPRHALGADASGVDSFDLEAFYGPCRVVACDEPLVTKEFLLQQNIQAGERILFKTSNSDRGYNDIYDQWVGVDGDGAAYLASRGVVLVGIDWLGVKASEAPDNRAHTELLSQGVAVLEGIDLSKVSPGNYLLSALPLKLIGTDGAHARAVLIEQN